MSGVAPVKSTSGAGFAVEDYFGAYVACAMLARKAILGYQLGPPIRIDFQVRADGWHLDDALVLFNKSGTDTRWAISVRSSRQITPTVNSDFLKAAWTDLRGEDGSPFNATTDLLGIVTAPLDATVHDDLKELCRLGRHQDSVQLDQRIRTDGYASQSRQQLWESFRPREASGPTSLSDSPGELLKRLRCVESNLHNDSSTERIAALEYCRDVVAPPSSEQALWNAVLSEVLAARTAGGHLDFTSLTDRLKHNHQIELCEAWSHGYVDGSRKASHARLLEGWLSLGVPRHAAETLVADSSVGLFPGDMPTEGLAVLVGEFGSGKSVIAERIHLLDLTAFDEGDRSFIPVFLRARDVRGALSSSIEKITSSLSQTMRRPTRLVLDGLDEVGSTRANELIRESHELIHSNICTRILITLRAGLDVRTTERFEAPPLSEPRLNELSYLLTGRQYSWYGVPPPIRESIKYPLFAIIAMLQSQNARELPSSESLLIDLLVRKALGDQADEVMRRLRPLAKAAASSMAGDGRISSWDLGGPDAAADLLTTRLVVREEEGFRFTLPIFEQYFGAYALLNDDVAIGDILGSMESFERWRYSYVIAVGIGPWQKISNLIESLGKAWPGAACWVISQAISSDRVDEQPRGHLPDSRTCAEQIRRALTTIGSWLKPCLHYSDILDGDNSLPAVGALVIDQRSLIVSLHYDDEHTHNGVIALDRYPHPISVRDNPKIRFIQHSTAMWQDVGWAWRWALDFVGETVSKQFEQRQLPLTAIDALRPEREWSIIQGVMGHRVTRYSEVNRSDLIAVARTILPDGHDDTRVSYILDNGIQCDESEIRDLLRRAEDPDSVLAYPWPGPDQEAQSSTRWSHRFSYSLKQALIRDIYTSAIIAYQHAIERFFPRFIPTLKYGSVLPFGLDILLKEDTSEETHFGSVISVRQILLDAHEEPKVSVALSEDDAFQGHWYTREHLAAAVEHQARLRPWSVGWSYPWEMTTVLDIFGDSPVTDIVFEWLKEDMQELGLLP